MSTLCYALSYCQPTFKHRGKLDNPNTNNNRIVFAKVKEFICNWIGEKTMDSHLLIDNTLVQKLLVIRMLGRSDWPGYFPMVSNQSLCCADNADVVFSLRDDDLSLCVEMTQHIWFNLLVMMLILFLEILYPKTNLYIT